MSAVKKVTIDYLEIAKSIPITVTNPSSVPGSTALFRFFIAGGGPLFHMYVEEMKSHPDGRRLLRDRPDLGPVLDNLPALGKFPKGSVGRVYHDFMNRPGIFPAYLLASQGHRGDYFNRHTRSWTPEAKWLAERILYTHDLCHALAGYNGSIAGEALNGVFEAASFDRRFAGPAKMIAKVMSLARTSVGRARWIEAVDEALARGLAVARTIPWHSIYWEELLDKPMKALEEVVGIVPLKDPDMQIDGWIAGRFIDWMGSGFGTLTRDSVWLMKMKRLVEDYGMSPKDLWRVGSSRREQLYKLLESGATREQLHSAVA